MLLPIISAFLGILAFLPFNFWFLAFFFLVPFFIFILKEKGLVKLVSGAFVFKIIFLAGTAYFVLEPLLFLFSILIFLGFSISIFLAKKITKYSNLIIAAIIPFLWVLFDILEARYSFLPFYVITLGNTIGNSPFLGLANYGGIIFLTFFAALINILMAAIILKFDKNLGLLKNRFSAILAIIAIALFLAGWQFSQSNLQKNSNDYNSRQKILKTAVLSNNEKFDEEFLIFKENTFSEDEKKLAEAMILDKLKLIRTDIIGKNIDILVFPEDMIDIEIWNNADKQAFEKFNISNAGILISSYGWLAKELNTYLAATITTIRNGKRYNSTILFDRNGELIDISDKSILTITSEWWPFEKWYPFYYNWFLKTAPDINKNIALFNKKYNYEWGRKKLLKTGDFEFASLICIETHYPNEFKKSMELGAEFIINSSNSRWVPSGLNHYLYLTTNLRKIESVWQNVPIIINGRDEKAGIITPDGKTDLINFESGSENYGLFVGEVGY